MASLEKQRHMGPHTNEPKSQFKSVFKFQTGSIGKITLYSKNNKVFVSTLDVYVTNFLAHNS
jgi:hypothetical protein